MVAKAGKGPRNCLHQDLTMQVMTACMCDCLGASQWIMHTNIQQYLSTATMMKAAHLVAFL